MSSNYVCIACGHEGTDEFEMRRMSTGEIQPVCYGCIDKYEEACRESEDDGRGSDPGVARNPIKTLRVAPDSRITLLAGGNVVLDDQVVFHLDSAAGDSHGLAETPKGVRPGRTN